MPHISKKKLDKETLSNLHKRLVATLRDAGAKSQLGAVLDQILTETEEIMIAKRLSIIFLLDQGATTYFIYKKLNVSPRTVTYMKERFLQDEYDAIQKLFKNKKETEKMWSYLEVIVRGGMPAYGKDRWKGIFRETK